MENKMGAFPRGQDVRTEIGGVDLPSDGAGGDHGFLHREASETAEVRGRIAESRFAQRQETLNIPLLDVALIGIDVDAKVGDEAAMLFLVVAISGLENVQALYNKDVGAADHLHFLRNNIIDEMRIDGHTHHGNPRLDIGAEAHQAAQACDLGNTFLPAPAAS